MKIDLLEYLIKLGTELATPYGLIALGVLIIIIAIQWKLDRDKYGKKEETKIQDRPGQC